MKRYRWTDGMVHGTANAYTNGGCRCAECTKAVAKHRREYTHRTGRHLPWDLYLLRRRMGLPG